MKYPLIISLAFTTLACTSNPDTDMSVYNYALVSDSGTQLSVHKNENDCNGAAVIQNIRNVNDYNGTNKPYQRSDKTLSQAVCKAI